MAISTLALADREMRSALLEYIDGGNPLSVARDDTSAVITLDATVFNVILRAVRGGWEP